MLHWVVARVKARQLLYYILFYFDWPNINVYENM